MNGRDRPRCRSGPEDGAEDMDRTGSLILGGGGARAAFAQRRDLALPAESQTAVCFRRKTVSRAERHRTDVYAPQGLAAHCRPIRSKGRKRHGRLMSRRNRPLLDLKWKFAPSPSDFNLSPKKCGLASFVILAILIDRPHPERRPGYRPLHKPKEAAAMALSYSKPAQNKSRRRMGAPPFRKNGVCPYWLTESIIAWALARSASAWFRATSPSAAEILALAS